MFRNLFSRLFARRDAETVSEYEYATPKEREELAHPGGEFLGAETNREFDEAEGRPSEDDL